MSSTKKYLASGYLLWAKTTPIIITGMGLADFPNTCKAKISTDYRISSDVMKENNTDSFLGIIEAIMNILISALAKRRKKEPHRRKLTKGWDYLNE